VGVGGGITNNMRNRNWKFYLKNQKMDVLTEWEITLKMQQQVLEFDRESLKKAKTNQEERTSKQYEVS
jgi:hypothetical protein